MELTSTIIEDTIENLNTRGWCRKNLQDENGNVCVLGAFYLALGLEFLSHGVLAADWSKHYDVLVEFGDTLDISGNVAHWNDSVVTGKDEIVDKLTELAKDFRNRGR